MGLNPEDGQAKEVRMGGESSHGFEDGGALAAGRGQYWRPHALKRAHNCRQEGWRRV